MPKKLMLHIILLLLLAPLQAQTNTEGLYKYFRAHSFLKQNTYLANPAFTSSIANNVNIGLVSRHETVGFNNSPSLNVLGYSGSSNDKIGAGIGLFQETRGVLISNGAIANYAYKVQLNQNSDITLGFNFILNKTDLDRAKLITTQPDPTLTNFNPSLIAVLQPGIDVRMGSFNVGVHLKDAVDYNLKTSEFITPIGDKIVSGHLMYTRNLGSSIYLLEDSSIRSFINLNNNEFSAYTGTILFDAPRLGWMQVSYDDAFGLMAGIGFNLSNKIAISYNYENGNIPFGRSMEIGIIYQFKKNISRPRRIKRQPKKLSNSTLEKIKESIIPKKKDTVQKVIEKPKPKTEPRIRRIINEPSIDPGFYLIVNVFAVEENANRFIKKLKEEGLNANFFINPETNYRYVFIYKANEKEEVIEKFKTDMDGKYPDEKWILEVKN